MTLCEAVSLGHTGVCTTLIDTHVVDRGLLGVLSPLDR